jgi:TPP-dependent pyruvate/acetoin dehydrogenase alpha subunit
MQMQEVYRRMTRIRKFEEEGARLFKAGKIPGGPSMQTSDGRRRLCGGAFMGLSDDDAMNRHAPLL